MTLTKAIEALRRINKGEGTQRDLAVIALFVNEKNRGTLGHGLIFWEEVTRALAADPDDEELYVESQQIARG